MARVCHTLLFYALQTATPGIALQSYYYPLGYPMPYIPLVGYPMPIYPSGGNGMQLRLEVLKQRVINLYVGKEAVENFDRMHLFYYACCTCFEFYPWEADLFLVGTESGEILFCSKVMSTSHQVMSHHVMSHHVTSCHIISCHVTSNHALSRHIASYHVTSCQVMSHHVTLHQIKSCHVTSHRVISRYITSCHIASYHVILFI
jgi:hypothetical protein